MAAVTDRIDKAILKFIQNDIPLVSNPYAVLAEKLGITEDEICSRIDGFIESGLVRRYGAILRHGRAGYMANAMVVWKIEEGKQDEAGKILAASQAVSHLYSRPAYPDWPCNLFSMIHAKTEDELQSLITGFESKLTDLSSEHLMYRSVREFKKTSMRYFAEDDDERL